MTSAALTFGSVPLLSPNPPWADYAIESTADGTTWGNPAAVVATVASMLMDGENAKITRFGNREATIPLQIRGATLDAVAAGEAEVMAEVNKGRNTLTWSPPGWSTPSVFDVVYAILDFRYDDLAEKDQVTRYFTLTLVCEPSGRRELPTIVVADPVPTTAATVTSIDTCGSTTGWSVSSGWAQAVVSGDLVATSSGTSPTLDMTRTGLSTTFAADELLRLTMDTTTINTSFFSVKVNGVAAALAAAVPLVGPSAVYYYRVPAGATLNTLEIHAPILTGRAKVFKVRDVSRTNRMPSDGSTRQRSFTAEIGGTARTTASVTVEAVSPSTELGDDALIYTAPAGTITPPLRKYLTSSDTVSTSGPPFSTGPLLSGAYQDINTVDSVYTIPTSEITPGTYAIVARMISGATSAIKTIEWEASMAGSPWAGSITETGVTTVELGRVGKFYQLGVVTLPLVAVSDDAAASVVLSFDGVTGGSISGLDDVYLCNLDVGTLSWFAGLTTTGTPSKVAVTSATLDSPVPQWTAGTAGSTADDVSVARLMESPGVHEFVPGTLSIFVATPLATQQKVTVEAYERFQHHVTPLDS